MCRNCREIDSAFSVTAVHRLFKMLPSTFLPLLLATSLYASTDDVRFVLGEVEARPGTVVDVPLDIDSRGALSMVSLSVEYDPEALTLERPVLGTRLEEILAASGRGELLWHVNEQEGWFQVSLVVDFDGRPETSIPPGLLVAGIAMRFGVKPRTPPGWLAVAFTRSEAAGYEGFFQNGGVPVYNSARGAGDPFGRNDRFEGASEPELDDGAILVTIIGEVGIFVRGDPNMDLRVNLSDAVRVLDTLFRSGEPLACKEAADANGDGRIDLSDPVRILRYVFSRGTTWQPSEEPVRDLDPSGLGCEFAIY